MQIFIIMSQWRAVQKIKGGNISAQNMYYKPRSCFFFASNSS